MTLCIEAFRFEYGSSPVQYIAEGSAGSNTVVLAYPESGPSRLQTLMWNRTDNYNLDGQWVRGSLQRYEQDSHSSNYYQKTALRRVSEMVRLGFHAEALALLNAVLEVAVRWALTSCVKSSQKHAEYVQRIGHKRCLEIIQVIATRELESHDGFVVKLASAKNIYRSRNLYLHALVLPDSNGRLTLSDRRQLESLFSGFVDYHEQNQFLWRLEAIAEGHPAIRQAVIEEIDLQW